MKRITSLFILLILALLPLACQSRALTQPVTPNMGVGANAAATATP